MCVCLFDFNFFVVFFSTVRSMSLFSLSLYHIRVSCCAPVLSDSQRTKICSFISIIGVEKSDTFKCIYDRPNWLKIAHQLQKKKLFIFYISAKIQFKQLCAAHSAIPTVSIQIDSSIRTLLNISSLNNTIPFSHLIYICQLRLLSFVQRQCSMNYF